MEFEPEEVPVIGRLLTAFLVRRIEEFNATRGLEVSNAMVLHAAARIYASALAAMMKAHPPEMADALLDRWITNIRTRVEEELCQE
jgi:hypothetical protein